MKLKLHNRILLSATLIAGLLSAGLFCTGAGDSVRVQDFQAEEHFSECFEEEVLTGDLNDFPGWVGVCEVDAPDADRCCNSFSVSSDGAFDEGFHDWTMPLRL